MQDRGAWTSRAGGGSRNLAACRERYRATREVHVLESDGPVHQRTRQLQSGAVPYCARPDLGADLKRGARVESQMRRRRVKAQLRLDERAAADILAAELRERGPIRQA